MNTHNQGKDVSSVQPKDTEKHRTANTQRESFKKINESGQRITEACKVLELLTGRPPMTSRQISQTMGIERTNITRTIRDLQDAGKARIAYCAPCITTGRKVEHYTAVTKAKQLDLFNEGGKP